MRHYVLHAFVQVFYEMPPQVLKSVYYTGFCIAIYLLITFFRLEGTSTLTSTLFLCDYRVAAGTNSMLGLLWLCSMPLAIIAPLILACTKTDFDLNQGTAVGVNILRAYVNK